MVACKTFPLAHWHLVIQTHTTCCAVTHTKMSRLTLDHCDQERLRDLLKKRLKDVGWEEEMKEYCRGEKPQTQCIAVPIKQPPSSISRCSAHVREPKPCLPVAARQQTSAPSEPHALRTVRDYPKQMPGGSCRGISRRGTHDKVSRRCPRLHPVRLACFMLS